MAFSADRIDLPVTHRLSRGSCASERGPGPGLTTDLLQGRARGLTAVELDFGFASCLGGRFRNTSVRVFRAMRRRCLLRNLHLRRRHLSMLHHLSWKALQDRMFVSSIACSAQAKRLPERTDCNSRSMRSLHLADTLAPIDPVALPARLEEAGFRMFPHSGPCRQRRSRPRAQIHKPAVT